MRSNKKTQPTPIPGYRLLQPLGSGGYGEVWKCEAPGGLFKAIKFVYGNATTLDADVDRAAAERQAIERIKAIRHPFILSMDRVEIVGKDLVIVMELADKSLHDLLTECQLAGLPGVPRDELLGYLREAAEALDVMNWDHGLQHLDIKPRNLFLIGNHVKIGDFGVVNSLGPLTAGQQASVPVGALTPLYAAPEACLGSISPHCDQYSLAIVYQELLTGTLPFGGKNPRQVLLQQVQGQPDLEALPVADRLVVARALGKDPQERFLSCSAFVAALAASRTPAPLPAPPFPADRDGMKVTIDDLDLAALRETPSVFAEPVTNLFSTFAPADPSPGSPLALEQAQLLARTWPTPASLNRVVREMVARAGGKVEQTAEETLPLPASGDFRQQRYVSKLTLDLVRLKLDIFRRQWRGQVVRDDKKLYVFRVRHAVGLWQRWVGKPAGLTVHVLLARRADLDATTPVTLQITPFGCNREQGVQLLETLGPLLFESAAACFEVTVERRDHERIIWPRPLELRFLLPHRQPGDMVRSKGKDLSLTGIGFYLPAPLSATQVNIELKPKSKAPAVTVPAHVVRLQRYHDGWYEVGATFS